MSLAWRPLPLPPQTGVPVLLVSAEFGTSSYAVRVTDMANMWLESLDEEAICTRASSESTAIDPGDTPENMAKFLTSLRSALDPLQPGHSDTSLRLVSPTAAREADHSGLSLKVTCALPGFDSLRWPLHFQKCPPSDVATCLVLPLLGAHHARRQEIQALLQAIGQKDFALTKLSDKLEAMGIGLEHVFTTLSGRKGVSRAAANEKVKGLAPFNQRHWQADLAIELNSSSSTAELVDEVLGDANLRYKFGAEGRTWSVPDQWWLGLEHGSQLDSSRRARQETPSSCTQSSVTAPRATMEEDEFQIQATPPQMERHTERAMILGTGAEDQHALSTTDEEEEDSMIPDSVPPAVVTSALPLSTLGTIGGQQKLPAESQPQDKDLKQSKDELKRLAADDSETASEAPDHEEETKETPPVPSSTLPATEPMANRPTRMGVIGGQVQDEAAADDQGSESRVGAATGRHQAGSTSQKTAREMMPLEPAQNIDARGRASRRTDGNGVTENMTRETSGERADRRRDELKRQLEKKAAAQPMKKKRRF